MAATDMDQLPLFEVPPGRAPDKSKTKELPLRPLWTENKAKLIERYLYYFVLVTKHGTYIDGFAGPQRGPDNWAARLVLENDPQRLRHFYLFDRDGRQVAALNQLRNDHPGRDVQVFAGDFNDRVDEVLRPSVIRASEAVFCLLDQRTLECHWSTVERIAAYKGGNHKIEIFYFLANLWLPRVLASVRGDTARQWWGRDDWGTLTHMHGSARAELVSRRFREELGYASARAWAIYNHRQGRRVMYYMIHATDHPRAPGLMSEAYQKAVQPSFGQAAAEEPDAA